MLGQNIKAARLSKGWSQLELAKKYNKLVTDFNKINNTKIKTIGRTAVTHWETERYIPDVTSIPFLCQLLECSSDYLLGIDKIAQIKKNYIKEFHLDNKTNVTLTLNSPWESLTEEEKKELMDLLIEKSIELKKEK